MTDPDAPVPLAYISFPSAKDTSFASRYPGRATIEVVSIAPYERFRNWEDTRWMKRGDDYPRLKEDLSGRLLEVLEREVPQVAGKIAYHELFSLSKTELLLLTYATANELEKLGGAKAVHSSSTETMAIDSPQIFFDSLRPVALW